MCNVGLVLSQFDVIGSLKASWYFLEVLIGFSVIIFVHEFGHFILAKLMGVKVETFAIGFGPRLLGTKRGETDYCIRLLPLGGYVKMLGQEDFTLDQEHLEQTRRDPRSFLAKTPGQRMLIVAGGVVMNIIFAAVVFIVVFMHGLEFPAPIAGKIIPGSPAEKAGVKPGDKFVRVNGKKVLQFSEIMLTVALSDPNEPIEFEFERNGKLIKKKIKPIYNPEVQLPQIGIASAGSLTIWDPGPKTEGKNNLKEGDVIVEVDGIKPRIFYDVEQKIISAGGKPVKLVVRRKVDGEEKLITIYKYAHLLPASQLSEFPSQTNKENKSLEEPNIAGLIPRRMFLYEVKDPETGKSAISAGDVIVRVANILNPTGNEIKTIFNKARGEKVKIEILRGNKRIETKIFIPAKEIEYQVFLSNLVFDEKHPVVGGTISKIDIPKGAIIKKINDVSVKDWFDIIEILKRNKGKVVKMQFVYGKETKHINFQVPSGGWDKNITYGIDFIPKPLTIMVKGRYPHEAIGLGMRQTWYVIKVAYVTIQRFAFTRSIGLKQLSGPIDIIRRGKQIAELGGIHKLFYYLALISATLAVMNFLPLPVVDGGVMILLIAEKIKGSPIHPKVVAIWQTVGIVLIVGLFLLVTYNDIVKIIAGQ